MQSYPLTVAVLVVLMVAAVLVSALLETRDARRTVHRVHVRRTDHAPPQAVAHGQASTVVEEVVDEELVEEVVDEELVGGPRAVDAVDLGDRPPGACAAAPVAEPGPAVEPDPGEMPGSAAPRDPSQAVVVLVSPPRHGQDLDGDEGVFELGGLGVDSELAAVFFAAYVAAGAREWSRVTGWVTAPGEPPSLGIGAGDRLRGKPAQVCALLECADDGRNWVVLDHQTNIDLALERRRPEDEVLAGLVEWWRLATSADPSLSPEAVASVRVGLEAVIDELRGHPLEAEARRVLEATRSAGDAGLGLEERVVPAGALQPSSLPAAR